MQSVTNGNWTWWLRDHSVVVGWLRAEQFGEDIPLIHVDNSRDAQVVVALLTTIDARPVAA